MNKIKISNFEMWSWDVIFVPFSEKVTCILVWSTTFHNAFGQCHTFTLLKMEKFKFVPYNEETRPYISLILAENNPWEWMIILLHSLHDLPDSSFLNGKTYISISRDDKEAHKIEIRKKVSKRESTRCMPCTQYEKKTCQNIEDNISILDNFYCRLPFLYQGQHLDHLIPKETPVCGHEVTNRALELVFGKTSNCTQEKTFEMTRYTTVYKILKSWIENKTIIAVLFDTPEVEYHRTYISYDLLTLIGEVGGILGLTLGASAISLTESLFHNIPYY